MRERQGWAVAKPALNITGNHHFHKRSCCQADSKREKGGSQTRICKSGLKTKSKVG